jgi:serine/threonine protein kinase
VGSSNTINIEYTEAGSLRYLAPEVILRSAPAHPAIDIWAMGCILYWMINGFPPFNGSTKEEIQSKIVKADF